MSEMGPFSDLGAPNHDVRLIDIVSLRAYVRKVPINDIAPAHSITSSARASSVGGTSMPSALAALRLITSSYFVGACTGRSAGFWPLRIRSTYWAAERNWLARSDPYDIRPPALTR